MKRVLAFDLGASSGRAILGSFDGERIVLSEVHRFGNDPVLVSGTFYWDVLRLFHEVKQGILNAKNSGGFDALGIDTWGVDFGLLDAQGRLLANPVHYRDTRTEGIPQQCFQTLSQKELYAETGIQFLSLNTLYQLVALRNTNPALMRQADCLLFMADLLVYFLTGQKVTEASLASTSQLLEVTSRQWSRRLMTAFQLPERLFSPPLVQGGSVLGTLSPALCEELGCAAATVISVCEHDTASAIVAIPTQEKNPLYLSSGTWSLMGTELDEPIVTDMNFTNEGGYHHTIRYLKNIAGLWLIQESRRAWSRQGMDFTFGELEAMAVEAGPAESFIDPDDPVFATAGDVPERIRRYCERTRQPIPQSTGQVVRCIYESLARRYAQTKLLLEQATGTQYHTLHIIGGGIKDTFLCQMTANYTGCRVLAGPAEATALGNIAVQLIAMGELQDLHHARRVIAAGVTLTEYLPMV